MNICETGECLSSPNDIKVLLIQTRREVEELSKSTEAKLLLHDGKIAELCKYLKDNLSNSIRCMFADMEASGDLETIVSSVIKELFNFEVTLSSLGAVGNAVLDTEVLKSAIKLINENKEIALILDKDYSFTEFDLTGVTGVTIKGLNPKLRIKLVGSKGLVINSTHNNLNDLCFYTTNDITVLDLSGRYNHFDNVNFYGGNNNKGVGIKVSNYCNTFTNCSVREFKNNLITEGEANQTNFINCYLIGTDNAEESSNNIIINGGNNINFTNCDLEKGYSIVVTNGGIVNFIGCYIEGGKSKYHLLLNEGTVTIDSNYMNNIYVGKHEKCNLTIVNNTIEKINDNVYTLYCLEENIGYLVAKNNKFLNNTGLFTNVNYNVTGSNLACVRYYNGSSWNNGVKSDIQDINQDRCKTVDPSGINPVLITPFDNIKGGSTRPTSNVLTKVGTQFFDTHIMKLLSYRSSTMGWVDSLGNTPSAKLTSYPTSGEWKLGDIVFNSNPSAGSYIGWVCTSAGTPGTWKGFGKIE